MDIAASAASAHHHRTIGVVSIEIHPTWLKAVLLAEDAIQDALRGNIMPNGNYIAGRAFEYEVIEHFEKEGYHPVRSAGSHTPIDIVCLVYQNKGLPLAIQCKKYKKYKPKPDEQFVTLKVNATKLWCTKKKGQRGFDIEEVF